MIYSIPPLKSVKQHTSENRQRLGKNGGLGSHAHLEDKLIMFLSGERLGELISNLISSGNVLRRDRETFKLLLSEMILDIHMFDAAMKFRIVNKGDGKLIVTMQGDRMIYRKLISIPCIKIPCESHFSRCVCTREHREK